MSMFNKEFVLLTFLLLISSVAVAHTDGIYNPTANSVGDTQGIDSNGAAAAPALPALTFISSAAATGSGATRSATADIGTAVATRRVVLLILGGQDLVNLSSCTINTIPCDASSIATMTLSGQLAEYTGSALVQLGTGPVTITWTYASAAFYSSINVCVYTVDNTALASIVPVTNYTAVASANTGSVTIATSAGGVIMSGIVSAPGTAGQTITSSTAGLVVDAANLSASVSCGHANGTAVNASSNVTWSQSATGTVGFGAVALR